MTRLIALVTGGNKGIGFEVVRQLAERGMTVYLGCRDAERGSKAAEALRSSGDVRTAKLDVTDEAAIRAVLATIEAQHGRLDVLVNNAGVALSGEALEADPAVIRQSFETNVHGPARLLQLAAPLLKKSTAGRVVNLASGAGSLGVLSNPEVRLPSLPYAYCASKAALNAVTILFAKALAADGIKVNSVNPGYVKTDLSHNEGNRTPAQGAEVVVRYATLGADGPTGGFFGEKGALPW